jgi:pyruvate dehydrogenase E1 component beta subunit
MAAKSVKAAQTLTDLGIDAEVIDLRSVKPWDRECVFSSVRKTGHLVVADSAWKTGGIAGEIAASVAEECFDSLKAPIRRVCLPDIPAPTSASLEKAYYVHAGEIVSAVKDTVGRKEKAWHTKSRLLTHENITAD